MNHTSSGGPQASLPTHQAAAQGGQALLPPVSPQGRWEKCFAPFRSNDKLPGSLLDCSLTSPFKSQRKGHGTTWLICTNPSCNPTCNSRCLWLTVPWHSYTTLLHNACQELGCLPGGWEEGQAAGRPGDGGSLPRSWELMGALSGIAELVGFGTGHRGKAPSQSERDPQDTSPSCLPFHKLWHFNFFFLGDVFTWGWWIMGCIIWIFCSVNSLCETCSHF